MATERKTTIPVKYYVIKNKAEINTSTTLNPEGIVDLQLKNKTAKVVNHLPPIINDYKLKQKDDSIEITVPVNRQTWIFTDIDKAIAFIRKYGKVGLADKLAKEKEYAN